MCMTLSGPKDVKYGDVHHETEVQFSKYNFELSDREMLFRQFESYETGKRKAVKAGVVCPAYDYCLKCSHTFNLLDAAGAISVTERTGYIGRVRKLARLCAHAYLADREAKGFPMLKKTVRTVGCGAAERKIRTVKEVTMIFIASIEANLRKPFQERFFV